VGELACRGRGILLDVEGTTSSVAFVYEVLFPYAKARLDAYFDAAWNTPPCAAACEQISRDAGHASLAAWSAAARAAPRELVRTELVRLMEADAKTTGLKQWQGLVWEEGYRSGALVSHVYDDVAPALRRWQAGGLDVRIYSSGSVAAQKLFFGHTTAGDLLPLLLGHYDTTVGAKREPGSYRRIAADMGLSAGEILFASDVSAELDAARRAGMHTALVIRPGNAPQPPGHGHREVRSLAEL
jgi:enolase-phosphatase E1